MPSDVSVRSDRSGAALSAARARSRTLGCARSRARRRLARDRHSGRFSFPTPPLCQEALAEVVDRAVEGGLELVAQGLGLSQLLEDLGALGLEEAIELALELLDPRGRHVIELAGRRRVQDGDLLLDRQRLVLRLLDDLRQLLA